MSPFDSMSYSLFIVTSSLSCIVSEIAGSYSWKVASFLRNVYLAPSSEMSPLDFRQDLSRALENSSLLCVSIRYRRVTDRQTDRQNYHSICERFA